MFLGRTATVLACFAVAVASMPFANMASAQPGQAAVGSEGVQPAPAELPSLTPFWTKYAYFVPSRFSDLPGWRDDSLAEAWKAFRASCAVLANRAACYEQVHFSVIFPPYSGTRRRQAWA